MISGIPAFRHSGFPAFRLLGQPQIGLNIHMATRSLATFVIFHPRELFSKETWKSDLITRLFILGLFANAEPDFAQEQNIRSTS